MKLLLPSDIQNLMLTPPHEWLLETIWLIGKLELVVICQFSGGRLTVLSTLQATLVK